jgi:hypothetical protein
MRCRERRSHLIEMARGRLFDVQERRRAENHLAACADCGRFLEEQRALTAALLTYSGDAPAAPPDGLELRLLAEFAPARRRSYGRALMVAGTLAAAMAAAWFVRPQPELARPQPDIRQPIKQPGTTRALVATAAPQIDQAAPASISVVARVRTRRRRIEPPVTDPDPQPFVMIPYTLPMDPRERAAVMRMEMPVSALAAAGLPVATPDPGASARTEVMIGEDGRIRAIRLLSISDSNSDRSIHQ